MVVPRNSKNAAAIGFSTSAAAHVPRQLFISGTLVSLRRHPHERRLDRSVTMAFTTLADAQIEDSMRRDACSSPPGR
jgi:hypothetical protein